MGFETLLPKILEGASLLDFILFSIVGYFVVKEVNIFNDIKNKVHKYERDIIVLKKDVGGLKKQLEKLDDEHRELHPRKGGKHY
ncbi:MAG: hypothetical protein FIB07_06940 [Candidatus Methanoperedens sp.]|nr:hypothetical protein [Candidatus Methanoperedens sp.]